MRGSVKRRCTKCGSRKMSKIVGDTGSESFTCPDGHDTFSWSFVVDISRPGEQRKQIMRSGFGTRRAAETELVTLVADQNRGERVELSKISLADLVEQWLARIRNEGRAQSTLNSYRRNLELHVLPSLGSVRLQAIGTGDLDQLYNELLEVGRVDGDGGLSPRSVRYVHTILGAVLKDAVRKGLLVRNPAEFASPPSAKTAQAPEGAFWTHEQLGTFLVAAANHELWPLWRTAAMTGMRRGELCGLRWTDVDLAGNTLAPGRISIVQQYAPDGVGGFQFGPPKSKQGHRLIDLDPSTVAVLKRWKTAQLEQRVEILGLSGRPELVFGRPEGGPLRPDSGVSKAFERIVKRLDVPSLSIHGLRHTHCCHLVAAGMDLKAISARMGHASVSFTLDRYAHLLPGQQAHVAATVADLVDSVSNL